MIKTQIEYLYFSKKKKITPTDDAKWCKINLVQELPVCTWMKIANAFIFPFAEMYWQRHEFINETWQTVVTFDDWLMDWTTCRNSFAFSCDYVKALSNSNVNVWNNTRTWKVSSLSHQFNYCLYFFQRQKKQTNTSQSHDINKMHRERCQDYSKLKHHRHAYNAINVRNSM